MKFKWKLVLSISIMILVMITVFGVITYMGITSAISSHVDSELSNSSALGSALLDAN